MLELTPDEIAEIRAWFDTHDTVSELEFERVNFSNISQIGPWLEKHVRKGSDVELEYNASTNQWSAVIYDDPGIEVDDLYERNPFLLAMLGIVGLPIMLIGLFVVASWLIK